MTRSKLVEVKKAFVQEVSVWSKLSHPNVTEVTPMVLAFSLFFSKERFLLPHLQFLGASLGTSSGFSLLSEVPSDKGERFVGGGICCVVLEYMNGGTLKDYLIKNCNKKLPFKTVMRIALDIARG